MGEIDRRAFLQLAGIPAVAAAMPAGIDKALAIPAHHEHRSIQDVEHVIFMMQENRSFDHYFGTLRGVRGFADPHPVKLPNGKSVWHQPDGNGGELLPFRPDVKDVGKTFLPDPPHGWNDGHAAWNQGRYDAYVPNKGVQTMTHHTREDLPYQFALADAFTVCDNYHCSLLGPTDPNRYHMWTGWVGNDGKGGGPVISNAEAGYDWSTYPERLERNGISWKIYQDIGLGLDSAGYWGWTDDPFIGNYGDNSVLYFHQYQNAAAGTPLAKGAKTGTNVNALGRDPQQLLTDLRADVKNGTLPQVTWIVAPEAFTEHPNWAPDFGAWYVSQVVDILASNPEIWSKMALFITYDEEGGFFDHVVPPTPPQSAAQGRSTVSTKNEIYPGSSSSPAGPYGLGLRVPMLIVSPWTRGGWVNSQLFDHTSLIRFLETRFAAGNKDLIESNITPWRRAVTGDLTSAFDFTRPNRSRFPKLPDTSDLKPTDLTRQPDDVPVPPTDPALPTQERGVRPARALPYSLHADGRADSTTSYRIDFRTTGKQAAVYQVWSTDPDHLPRSYTVEPGKRLKDTWDHSGSYDLSVYGPNGFHRHFAGNDAGPISVTAQCDDRRLRFGLQLQNTSTSTLTVMLTDRYLGKASTVSLTPGQKYSTEDSTRRCHGWYDVKVTIVGTAGFEARFAGHLEDGDESITDPGMGGLV